MFLNNIELIKMPKKRKQLNRAEKKKSSLNLLRSLEKKFPEITWYSRWFATKKNYEKLNFHWKFSFLKYPEFTDDRYSPKNRNLWLIYLN